MMKAYSLEAVNDLVYKDVPVPVLKPGWALIKVKASGICSSDIARIFKNGTYHFPTIPGHEFSGIVEKVESENEKEWLGKKVSVFPLIPCNECNECNNKNYEMCENYDYLGSRRNGGFAEYVAVPVWNLLELPADADLTEFAMLEPLSVALHAIKCANIKKGDSVSIVGTGMIGICAAIWAKKYGAGYVQVLGRNENKRNLVYKYQDIKYVNIKSEKALPTNIVLEAVGSDECVNQAIDLATPGGRIIALGNPASDILLPQKIYWRILRKQLLFQGVWNSKYEHNSICDWSDARDALCKKEIDIKSLVTHKYNQNELMTGLKMMQAHKESYCKVMTLWNE